MFYKMSIMFGANRQGIKSYKEKKFIGLLRMGRKRVLSSNGK
jgi:hypothetical protein